jgi:hypothetical protein
VEGLGDVDGFLAERAVGDEQDLVGLDAGAEVFDLLDQVLVDLEPAGGVEDDAVGGGGAGGGEGGGADGGHVLRGAVGVEGELLLPGEDLELVDGGGAVDVAGGDERAVAAFLEERPSLAVVVVLPEPCRPTMQDLQRAGPERLGLAPRRAASPVRRG